MLTPQEAYEKLKAMPDRLGFDDTSEAGPPLRWYWFSIEDGRQLLASCFWRGYPKVHEDFERPSAVKVEISSGRGKYGKQYAYIRPAKPCANRSRRVAAMDVDKWVRIIFPKVNYWNIGGLVIGARDEDHAWTEYWRVCEKEQIRKKQVEIFPL